MHCFRRRRIRTLQDPDDSGKSPLYYACCFGHVDVVGQLLKAGANPNQASIEPAEFLKCRKMYNWCPRLGLLDGRVSNLLANRQIGSTAELTCDAGLEMKFGDTVLGKVTLKAH
eukprot:g963.t1